MIENTICENSGDMLLYGMNAVYIFRLYFSTSERNCMNYELVFLCTFGQYSVLETNRRSRYMNEISLHGSVGAFPVNDIVRE